MMKRKILAVTIPVVGCITVVGAGFSAWYFSESTGEAFGAGFGVNINVTEEVKNTEGTLSIERSNANTLDKEYLILDQGGVSNKAEATKGIMFSDKVTNETVDREVSYEFELIFDGSQDLTLNEIYDAKMEVALSVSFNWGERGTLNEFVPAESEDTPEAPAYIGTWTGKVGQNTKTLVLNSDGTGSYGGASFTYVYNGDEIVATADDDAFTLTINYDETSPSLDVTYDDGKGLGAYLETAGGASLDVTYSTLSAPNTKTQEFDFERSGNVYTAEFAVDPAEFENMSEGPIQGFTWKCKVDLSTKDLANALLKYANGKKPQNSSDLEAMTTAVESETLNFTTTAKIREKKN